MSFNIYATYFRHTAYFTAPTEALPTDKFGLPASWDRRLATMVATSTAVLLVAAGVVLMGIAEQPRNSNINTFNAMEACQMARADLAAGRERLTPLCKDLAFERLTDRSMK